jgi:hypothetical protein
MAVDPHGRIDDYLGSDSCAIRGETLSSPDLAIRSTIQSPPLRKCLAHFRLGKRKFRHFLR